ncbi:DUF1444 domain-containing protein [Allokutzneria albata]|uniref:Uncharacterized protein n=1 Tax=Allokutzneria albata TaxID=211114 RepID=A0A1G9TYB0_ALLAB|nr:hypothetical protein [Allokutzneria albata]SDM52573.1 hypothetical protein SAMN04489726_2059 [Allokutzneria albata]
MLKNNDRDPALPALTVNQARMLRVLVKSTMTRAGRDVTVHADHVVDSDDSEYGLDSLSRTVRDLPVKDWPAAVERHISTMQAAMRGPDEFDVPTADLLDRTYLRLYDAAGLPPVDWLSYAREPFPGVRELLALDLPDTVSMFNDDRVERHGLDVLREAGLRNLRQVTPDQHTVYDGVQILMGSVYMASTALVLDDVIRRTTGEQDLPNGVLVAMPFRNQLLYHVPRDHGIIESLNAMASLALNGFADEVGPISPYVYWWDNGVFQQLTKHDEQEKTIEVHVDGGFAEVFRRLVP